MTDALTVSAIQYQALKGGIAPNVQEHVRLIEDADSHGARLVVFPELSLTGYDLALLAADDAWLRQDDPRMGDLLEICRRTGITAVAGAAYREPDGTPRLAGLAIHPHGGIDVAVKAHLAGQERELFAAGGHAPVLELDGWTIALAIGSIGAVTENGAITENGARKHSAHENSVFEPSAVAPPAGVDIYAVSALYTAEDQPRLALHLEALAMDNRVFGVVANLGGSTPMGPSCGLSGFWGPDGAQLKKAAGTGTEVITAVLQRSDLRRYR